MSAHVSNRASTVLSHQLSETILGQSTDLFKVVFTIVLSAVLHPMAQSGVSLVAKLQAASTCGDEATHQDRLTNDPHGFPEMIAEWEETVKKHTEQAESQNDSLAKDKLKQSAEARINTRSKEYAVMLRKMTPEQENAYQSTKKTSAKAQFRHDWAKEQYALAKKSRVEKQSWKEADADIGEYKVLAKIVEDEGFAVDAPGAFTSTPCATSSRSCTCENSTYTLSKMRGICSRRRPYHRDVDFHREARLHFDCHGQARWSGDTRSECWTGYEAHNQERARRR